MQVTYQRHATKLVKHTLDLSVARDHIIIDRDLTALTILRKGTGTWTLTLEFPDETTTDLTDAEVSDGQRFPVDIRHLALTNTAQTGVTLIIAVEKQQPEHMVKAE